MKKLFSKLKNNKKLTTMSLALTMSMASASLCFADGSGANTGNSDLDSMIGTMHGGLTSIKTGGMYLVGAVITVAVVFLGGRWLWNLFRGWLAKAA